MSILATTLPDNSGYVAAAYLVFFVLLLIYVAIMASKLGRIEKELVELNELVDRRQAEPAEAPSIAPEEVPSA